MVELVSAGHPDKVADAISDVVVNEYLKENKNNKVACETLISNRTIVLAGEVIGNNISNETLNKKIKEKLNELGYNPDYYIIHNCLIPQSNELTVIADNKLANDQCIVYGYANKNENAMPEEYTIGYKVLNLIKTLDFVCADAKVLVDKTTIKISTSHISSITLEELREKIIELLSKNGFADYIIEVNPAGTFIKYGPDADCGVTGRKIVVDAYGAGIAVGGGAYSGKDFTKLDRSAAYMARLYAMYLIKHDIDMPNLIIEVSYMIGDNTPVIKKLYYYDNNLSLRIISDKYNKKEIEIFKPENIINFFNENVEDITDLTWCPYMSETFKKLENKFEEMINGIDETL